MKFCIIILFSFFIAVNSSAESDKSEIYESLLNQNTDESLDSLYGILQSKVNKEHFSFIKRYYKTGIQSNSDSTVFKAYRLMGRYYRNINEPDSAKIIYEKSINYNYSDKKYSIKSKTLLASLMILIKEYDKALDILTPLIKETDASSFLRASIYSLLGNVYRSINQLDDAISYLKKAYKIQEQNNKKISMADMSVNFIALYAMNGDFEKAMEYGENAIKIYKELDDKERIGDVYMNLAYINFTTKDYYGAIDYYQKALEIERQTNNSNEDVVGLLNNISRCYINLGETQKAIEALEQILEIDNQNYYNMNTYLALEAAHYNLLQEYLQKKDFDNSIKTFDKLSAYSTIKDSILKAENNSNIAQAIAEATAKFENQILLNEKTLAETKNELSQRRILYLLITVVLFILFIIILLIQNNKRKKLAEELKEREVKLTKLNSELFDKIDKLIKSVTFKDKLLSVISHDLQSPVVSLKMLSESIVKDADKLDKSEIVEKSTIFSEISSELSVLLTNLLAWIKSNGQSINVDKTDFNIYELSEDIVKLYEKSASEKKIKIHNNINQSYVVYADRNMIATVLRNLLSNALKFSDENTEIHLNSEIVDNKIKISVKDEGRGIDKEHLENLFIYDKKNLNIDKDSGIGLKISKEFLDINEGEIYAKSVLGAGSEFGFKIDKK
jgi:signal transduction histidine kinase